MNRLTKILFWMTGVLFLAVLIFAGAAALEWRKSARSAGNPELLTPPASPDSPVNLAKRVTFTAEVRVPWGRSYAAGDTVPGSGSQLVDSPAFQIVKTRWGYSVVSASVAVQAYRPGAIPAGKMTLVFEGGSEGRRVLEIPLPGFQAVPSEIRDGDVPQPAGLMTIPVRENHSWYYFVGAFLVLAVLVFLAYRKFGKRSTEPARLPPWESALASILSIRQGLHAGKSDAAFALVGLTDVLRRYLEIRFRCRAEHQTTREFLDDLAKDGPLDSDQQDFMKDFLTSADMVKFAKAPADVMAFDTAAEKAETLVRATAVNPNGTEAVK